MDRLLLLPRPIQILAPEDLPLLENSHGPPFRLISRVHIATGFDAETRAFAASRRSFDLGNVDILASVELEGRLGAVHLQVHLCVRVGETGQELQRLSASVQSDLGGVSLGDKDIVNVRLGWFQDERGGDIAGEFLDSTERDTGRIKRQVVIGKELGFGPLNRGGICKIEIALADQPTDRVCRAVPTDPRGNTRHFQAQIVVAHL